VAHSLTEHSLTTLDAGPPRRRASAEWLPVLWTSLAVLPFLITGIRAATGDVTLGTDFGLSELAISDAAHLHQTLGAYSRMGWAHPGPAWYYALAPVFTLLGSTGSAFIASFLVLQALAAALIVVVAGRRLPWAQPIAAAAVLGYGLLMPTSVFVTPWNPYALLLPAALLLLLVARSTEGSLTAVAGTALVGTFLVQTHIGTTPLVAAATLVALATCALARPHPSRSDRCGGATLAALAVAGWVPPLWQQWRASDGNGNLSQIFAYFTQPDVTAERKYSWMESLRIVARVIAIPVYSWPGGDQLVPFAQLPLLGWLLLLVQAGGTALLLVVGIRTGSRRTMGLALALGAAAAAALFSAHSIRGDAWDYLVLWATVLPVVLAAGWLDVLLSRLPSRRAPVAAAAVVLAVLAVCLGAQTVRTLDQRTDEPGVDEAVALLQGHLGDSRYPVQLDIRTREAWALASGVAARLEQQGYQVHVDRSWLFMFGARRAVTGAERVRVELVDAQETAPDTPPGVTSARLGAVVGSQEWAVVVTSMR
jgi:hypothetical protein